MFGIGAPELILILVIILVIFGGAKLPELAKAISGSIKEIRKGFSDSEGAMTTKPEGPKSDKN